MKIREATALIGYLESGELSASLTEELNHVIEACQDAAGPKRSAKGSVTLKIDVKVEGINASIIAHVSGVVPKTERASTFLFVGQDGELTTEHPTQHDMFPRDVKDRA